MWNGTQSDGEANLERKGRHMGLLTAGGCYGGCGITGDGDLRPPPPGHSHPVYCDKTHYGPVYDGGDEAGVKDDQLVVGAGRIVCGGDADSGSGCGMDGGGVGYGRYGDGERLSQWKDNVAHVTLGTETNYPLAYAPVLEH